MIYKIQKEYNLLPSYEKQGKVKHSNCRIQTTTSLLNMIGYDIDPNLVFLLSLENLTSVAKVRSKSKIPHCIFLPYLNAPEINVLSSLGIDYSKEKLNSINFETILDDIKHDKLPIVYFFDAAKLLKRRASNNFELGVVSSAIIVGASISKSELLLNALASNSKYNPVSFIDFGESRKSNLLPFQPQQMTIHIKSSTVPIENQHLELVLKNRIDTLVSNHVSSKSKSLDNLSCYDITHGNFAYDSVCNYLTHLDRIVTDDVKFKLFQKVFSGLRLGICSGSGTYMRRELVDALKYFQKQWPNHEEVRILIQAFNKTKEDFRNLARYLYNYQIEPSSFGRKLDIDIIYIINTIKRIKEIENTTCIEYLNMLQ